LGAAANRQGKDVSRTRDRCYADAQEAEGADDDLLAAVQAGAGERVAFDRIEPRAADQPRRGPEEPEVVTVAAIESRARLSIEAIGPRAADRDVTLIGHSR